MTDPLDMLEAEELREAWEKFALEHIEPSRMVRIGVGLEPTSPKDARHLAECKLCKDIYDEYGKTL